MMEGVAGQDLPVPIAGITVADKAILHKQIGLEQINYLKEKVCTFGHQSDSTLMTSPDV